MNRLLEKGLTINQKGLGIKGAIIPLLSVLLSQVALWTMLVYVGGFLRNIGVTDGIRLFCTLVLLAFGVIYNWKKKTPAQQTLPVITWLVPLWFHVFFFAWLFIGEFYKENIWLVVAGAASLLAGITIHLRSIKSEEQQLVSLDAQYK